VAYFIVIKRMQCATSKHSMRHLWGMRHRLAILEQQASLYCKATKTCCMDLMGIRMRVACKCMLSDPKERDEALPSLCKCTESLSKV